MRTPYRCCWLLAAFLTLLPSLGCVTLDQPIASAWNATPDPRLIGVWAAEERQNQKKPSTIIVHVGKPSQLVKSTKRFPPAVVWIVMVAHDQEYLSGVHDEALHVSNDLAYPVVIGNKHYLNVLEITSSGQVRRVEHEVAEHGWDGIERLRPTYSLYRYEFRGPIGIMHRIDGNVVAKATAKGLLTSESNLGLASIQGDSARLISLLTNPKWDLFEPDPMEWRPLTYHK